MEIAEWQRYGNSSCVAHSRKNGYLFHGLSATVGFVADRKRSIAGRVIDGECRCLKDLTELQEDPPTLKIGWFATCDCFDNEQTEADGDT